MNWGGYGNWLDKWLIRIIGAIVLIVFVLAGLVELGAL
jgi:hypothetical protein